jgi:branched-chain amino acid transport system permease protein
MDLALSGAIDGLLLAWVYALMASGLTLVFGVMRLINVAQAAFVVLGGYLSYTLWDHTGLDPFAGLVVTMPAMFVVGVVVERLFISRLQQERLLMSLLVTFALAIAVQGIVDVVFSTDFIKVPVDYATDTFDVGGHYIAKVYVLAAAVSVAILVGLYGLLYRTTFGRTVRAASENPLGARVIGVDLVRVSAIAFGIGTALAAAGGAALVTTTAIHGATWYTLVPTLLAIVILGGLGSITGAVLASVLLLVSESVTAAVWTPAWATSVPYIALIVVLLLRPHGIAGRREARAE